MSGRTLRTLAPTMLALALAGGCSTAGARGSEAAAVAERFERAVRKGDTAAACRLLAPQTLAETEHSGQKRCASALKEEQLPDGGAVRESTVYGQQAMVTLQGDTLFLSLFRSGWRVVAAGCVPEAGEPYDCQVKGG
ncbi:hypothetical protein ACWGI8_07370 [Streptomyces sp. NPDC054841]